MSKLSQLTHPNDDPALVREACFYVGWMLKSPDSWEYRNVFTGETGEVAIADLVLAIQAKRDRLSNKVVDIKKYAEPTRRSKR